MSIVWESNLLSHGVSGELAEKMPRLIKECYDHGLDPYPLVIEEYTADEIAELLNLSSFTVRPRVTELYKQGKIERTDTRRNASKRNAYVYVISKEHINNQLTEKGV